MGELSHFDEQGASRMVDVSGKAVTLRLARASGSLRTTPQVVERIRSARVAKGDVLGVARVAGIQAAKRTGDLIPLCHPVGLDSAQVEFVIVEPDMVRVEARAQALSRTGVEMEALVAVSVALLTIYDMCKSLDRTMVLGEIRLEEKSGGRSGHFRRSDRER